MNKFETTDGYVLHWIAIDEVWTDGDLDFDADTDGWPVDSSGNRLDGAFV